MSIELRAPWFISARLLPAIQAGDVTISISYSRRPGRDGRTRYQYFIDGPGGLEYSADDLQSGACGGNLAKGMESLLSFLSAFLEAQRYPESENRELFPAWVADYATDVYFGDGELAEYISE